MSYIFWKLLFQRLILAINEVFLSIQRCVRILLTHCNRIEHKIWHLVLQTILSWGGLSFYEGYEKGGQLKWLVWRIREAQYSFSSWIDYRYWYSWSGWTNASSGRLTISWKPTSQVHNIHWCFQTNQVLFYMVLVWAHLHLQPFSDNELVGQIGDGDVDHAWWGRPEEMTMNRFPVMMVMT